MLNKTVLMALVCSGIAQFASVQTADACGSIVAIDGEASTVSAQRVIMGYTPETNTTRVVAQISYDGELAGFSWLIPLPTEPAEISAIGEADAELFGALDDYASPAFTITSCGLNNGGGGNEVGGNGVRVLDSGITGTFEYVVLTGDSGTVVTEWLGAEGYSLPEGMGETLHTYIREGSLFLALKVNPKALGVDSLDPGIRFDYQGNPGYPLRILQPTVAEEVEVILNVFAPEVASIDGETTISDVVWSGGTPEYLKEVRARNTWVAEYRGGLDGWTVGDFGGVSRLAPDNMPALIDEVLGLDASTVQLSRFHGIFTADGLGADSAIAVGLGETHVTHIDRYTCDWEDDDEPGEDYEWEAEPCNCDDGVGFEDDDRSGCSSASGNTSLVGLILFGFVGLMRRRRN